VLRALRDVERNRGVFVDGIPYVAIALAASASQSPRSAGLLGSGSPGRSSHRKGRPNQGATRLNEGGKTTDPENDPFPEMSPTMTNDETTLFQESEPTRSQSSVALPFPLYLVSLPLLLNTLLLLMPQVFKVLIPDLFLL
jgi:hypothetical protein